MKIGTFVHDIDLISVTSIDSYNLIATKEDRTNYLIWFWLRHSVPFFSQLKKTFFRLLRAIGSNNNFEVTKRDYYSKMITTKAQRLNCKKKLNSIC